MAWLWWDGFDKRMCGKWISEQFEINGSYIRILLYIEQSENEVTVKFDFDNDSFNSKAFYVEYSYNSLYFFHNDRTHRAEYILTLDGHDSIKCNFEVSNCWGYDGKFKKDLKFVRLEALSEDEYKKFTMTNNVTSKNEKRIQILKEYSEYGNIESDIKFEFKFDERENMLDIIEKYNLDELAKNKSDIEIAIALMQWFCGKYRHGDIGLARTRTPQALMEFADKHDGKTNCRGLSIILSHLIRAYNIKAFHVTCSPYENPFDDCHVVVSVYCESLGKCIMLDPSNNLYLRNKNGEIIGIDEFRDILINDGELFPNEDWFNYNWDAGISGNKDCPDYMSYSDYMAKNLIRIERYSINGYGIDGNGGHVVLIPKKYMENEAKNFDEYIQKHFITSREYFWQIN